MAAPSTSPNNSQSSSGKKEFTSEQKKRAAVGALLALLFVGAVNANWNTITGGSSNPVPDSNTTASPTAAPSEAVSASGASSAGIAPNSGASNGSAPRTTGGNVSAIPVNYAGVNPSRSDPFAPFVIIPVPTPTPIPIAPTPTPIPPVNIPSPESLVSSIIPAVNASAPHTQQTLSLPGIVIPRMNVEAKAPRDAFPPSRQSQGNGSVAEPSYGKRLSGVVISDGVRALLEINGSPRKSYVVQPGDTIEGITVLDIQRFDEDGRTITRMSIRENGRQRYIDLKVSSAFTGTNVATGSPGDGR